MEFKGTKGEWAIVSDFRNPKIINEDGQVIFEHNQNCWDLAYDEKQGQEMHNYYSHNKMMSNTQLIAAAPDLLEALKEMLYMTGGSVRFSSGMSKTIEEAEQLAIKAIAKALG